MANTKHEEEQVAPNAWRVSAEIDSPYLIAKIDETNLYAAIKPGDAMVLLTDDGEKAWGIRKVFLVRHVKDTSVVYFDGGENFDDEITVPFVGEGDKTVLRRFDFAEVEKMLADAQKPLFRDLKLNTSDDRGDRTYVRGLLEKIVIDDLLGPAGGTEEEIVGMSVRDRYILGRLGPRKRNLSAEGDSADADQPETTAEGNADHADHEAIDGTDIADEETEEDVVDNNTQMMRSSSLVPSSMGLTFCIDKNLPDIEVEVSWGSYRRAKSATETKDGKPLNCWKRMPFWGKKTLHLVEGDIPKYSPDDRIGTVSIVGSVSKPIDDSRLVTLFLVNEQIEPEVNRDAAWIFQPEIIVRSPTGEPIFKKRPLQALSKNDDEMKALDMIYRKHVEFAVGHNISVTVETASDEEYEKARVIKTVAVPRYEVPATEVPGDSVHDRAALKTIKHCGLLDMRAIAKSALEDDPSKIKTGVLGQLVADYEAWIGDQREAAQKPEFAFFKKQADDNLAKCELILARLKEGVEVLAKDANARKAYAFANSAMADQRVHSIAAGIRRKGGTPDVTDIDGRVSSHEWRPFQLAFLLLSIPALVDLTHKDRTDPVDAYADLLWFPTGGGKTEAYLGVAAFTMAIRRLQGAVGDLDGSRGLSVIMRYTLRLLTVQQFQRASTLLCAMEMMRQADPATWGSEPFSLGLWVGSKTTPNTYADSKQAIKEAREGHKSGGSTPVQLTTCPWCGAPIREDKDAECDDLAQTTTIYCSDHHCVFSAAQDRGGIPVKTVDDEMYHRPPSMLIATADKFAQMAWRGSVRTLFGYAESECERHGLIYPDEANNCKGAHTSSHGHPATHAKAVKRIRPPDLIIQDEFHLISGPLGTMVGLYETAVDELCSWELNPTTKVHPKIIASTATVRMAGEQVNRVFYRQCSVFPPSGIDVEDNFFSVQRKTEEKSGRVYLGICALGLSRPAALIRTYVAFLTAGKTLFNSFGRLADPYMTAVGYFNSLRELGGMRRLSEDDVQTRSYRVALATRVKRPGLSQRRVKNIEELTSRVSSRDIPQKLDRLETEYKNEYAPKEQQCVDIVLATNMLSVGVDVNRLGLMIANGQPKNTAEYIQATSRVGRAYPGVVCTVFAWSRPRDFSHYEMFEHYHATFYKQVEAQSVTPFSARALDRGLTGAFISELRLKNSAFAPNVGAGELKSSADALAEAVKQSFVDRAWNVMGSMDSRDRMSADLKSRIDRWVAEATVAGRQLAYEKKGNSGTMVGFLHRPGVQAWDPVTVPTSMREVESSVRLIMDKRKITPEEESAMQWQFPKTGDEGTGEANGEEA